MKFEDWFYEVENFSLRAERFYNDMSSFAAGNALQDEFKPERIVRWLKAAYEAGYEEGVGVKVDIAFDDFLDKGDE